MLFECYAGDACCRYSDRGLPFCYVGYFDGMEEGTLRANIIEARVNDVSVRYERPKPGEESDMEAYSQGEVVPSDKIIASSGFKKGEHYHIDDGQDAINNIYACGLIEEINIEPEQDMTDPTKINIRVVVEEVQAKSMEVRGGGSARWGWGWGLGFFGGAGGGGSVVPTSTWSGHGTFDMTSILTA